MWVGRKSMNFMTWNSMTWNMWCISNYSLSLNYLSVWKISSCSARDREWQSCTEGRYGEWRTAPRGQWRVGGDADASWGCGQSETKTTGLLHHHHSTGAGILQPSEHHFPLIVHEWWKVTSVLFRNTWLFAPCLCRGWTGHGYHEGSRKNKVIITQINKLSQFKCFILKTIELVILLAGKTS